MVEIAQLFVTRLYRARVKVRGLAAFNTALEMVARSLSVDDGAGAKWSEDNDYGGYTSYASLNDLPWRFPEFSDLAALIDAHVLDFAQTLDFDLGGRKLGLDSLWVNILEPGGHHAAHIHPHSAISGTYYVRVPKGAAAIRFEDPRHAMMMSAPPRRPDAAPDNQPFFSIKPKEGDILLWESWLRHDVPVNQGEEDRISISFNYAWKDAE